jgi:hypothetical protein
MNTVWIKFLKYHSWAGRGETIEVSEDVGNRLVASKYGVIVPNPNGDDDSATKKVSRKKLSNKSLSASE